jgi:hypothetical protein
LRAGPLSDPRLISLLNSRFVCVFTSNEDYFGDTATVPKEERTELERIHREGHAAKMSVGTVHVYLLSPDGKLRASLHVAEAAEKEKLLAAVGKFSAAHPGPAGKPLVPPVRLSLPKRIPDGGAVLHVSARRDGRGSWGEFPGENWPVFTGPEWRTLTTVPEGRKTGDSWTLDAALCRRILNHFHPQTEDCSDKDRNDLRTAAITATLQNDGIIALHGEVHLLRSFYPGREDKLAARASVEGFIREGRLTLVTLDDARFGKEKFFAAASGGP